MPGRMRYGRGGASPVHDPRTFLGAFERGGPEGAAPEIARGLAVVLRELERHGVAELPRVGALDGALVARGLYHTWLEGRAWAPLLVVDPATLADADDLVQAAPVARGGWLYLGAGWERALSREAAEALAAEAGARLLLQSGASFGPVPPAIGDALRALDAVHAVATDPTLARARGALQSHCQRGETVYLSGPVGSGRRALARWAHATLDDRPLTILAAGSPPPPGTWWLVPEVGELDPAVIAPLRGRLEATEAPPPFPAAGGIGVRPDDERRAFAGIVGRSAALCDVLRQAARVAEGDLRVVILGESGTGKEPLAQAIHAASRRKGPFVHIDVASRSANLVEDDLFGHLPFAFDGARTARDGAFKRAHGGTLFLDEIGNLPLGVQAKLLRVLERREVQPLGSDASIPVDVRVICATNADLESMVRVGEFRRDLYFRLAGTVLRLPPLRARLEDLPALVRHFLSAARHPGAITPAALDVLRAHPWTGNVRELAQVIGQAEVASGGDPIEPEHLGDLAPSRARQAPVLVTGDAAALEAVPLPRRQVRQLAALTLTLDGPAERGAVCVRNAALHLLSGRAVTGEALRMLEAHPWWGGFVEMERKLAALAALPPGRVDPARLVACLPELGQASGWDPILALQHPTVGKEDAVTGLQASLAAAVVVVGRARRMADIEGPRAQWLARLAGDGSVAFLPFPHLPALSRLHVVVTRLGEGLLAHRAPGTRLEVRAGPVGGGVEAVPEGGFVALGDAGVLQVAGDDGPLVELYLFRGQVALRAAAPFLRASDPDVAATRHAVGVIKAWPLAPAEADWIEDFTVRFVDGEDVFSAALRREVVAAPTDKLGRYLSSANPPQSLARLLKGNAQVGARLRVALRPRWERARARLPAQVWAVLAEDDEPT